MLGNQEHKTNYRDKLHRQKFRYQEWLAATLLGYDRRRFLLDINNPKEPKILCVGNNPDRQNIYSATLGLYNSRIVKLINKKGQLKSSVIIDELPTIYFRGLDNLIATARSNKVAVCLGFQDYSQLIRDYGDKESKVIQNTVGNIFSGQVVGETARSLSERFGKVLQNVRAYRSIEMIHQLLFPHN